MLKVSALYIYPVKSVAGVSLQEARVERRGFQNDRRWMVVDEKNRFISQREYPRLALVEARVEPSGLELQAPGMETVQVQPSQDRTRVTVQVWRDAVSAVRGSPEADEWFSRFLRIRCRLVYMPPDSVRRVDPAYARDHEEVSFADGFPVLLASEGSLRDLNTRLKEPVTIRRFRPNLAVAGTEPFEEDAWREIRIGSVRFRVVKPCSRCAVINVNPETGLSTTEPLRTLASYRTVNGKAFFAQNLIPMDEGVVRVGDGVDVLQLAT
jgi:uncharacterized protein